MLRQCDPAESIPLLAEAGYPDGFELSVVTLHDDMGTYISGMTSYLEEIGIKVVPQGPDSNVLYLTST